MKYLELGSLIKRLFSSFLEAESLRFGNPIGLAFGEDLTADSAMMEFRWG
jgi:hypothetical protein